MISIALIVLTLIVAYANGANDVSKGIATLVGSGVASDRRAVLWGTLWTVAGALAASLMTQGLVATFSGNGILVHPSLSPIFLLAIASGAIGWLLIATRTGLPVSTTHSLAGALVGAAIVSSGWHGILWSAITSKVAVPLLASPLMALLLLVAVLPLLRPYIARFDRYCVCVETRDAVAVTPEGISLRQPAAAVGVGTAESCTTAVARFSAVDGLHWISSGATSFFRGVNDTPKIVALGIGAAAAIGASPTFTYALTALAMGAGGAMAGFRVTRTLARRVTPISPANGFAANLATSLLVGVASQFALPVSTTHVSTGAIVGVGIVRGGREVRWNTVGEMLLAWVVTLPVSALVAAAAYRLLA